MIWRVLIVDDYELWRRQIGSALRNDPRWQIVGEVADGLAAVEQARTLEPDVILMDVSLPGLSGIEAARRILARDAGARIVFMSEHRSWDIVAAALATTARGYIVKSDVGSDFSSVLEAIIGGRRFISASAVEPALAQTTPEPFSQRTRRHEAAFYSDEISLLGDYARFLGELLEAGHAAILVGGRSRLEEIQRRLEARGIDCDRATKEGRYLPLDLEDRFSTFMIDGRFDDARFVSSATSLLMKAASASAAHHLRVGVCGDGACTLWQAGKAEETIRLEQLWDQLARKYNIEVLCGYVMPAASGDQDGDVVQRICVEHSIVHRR